MGNMENGGKQPKARTDRAPSVSVKHAYDDAVEACAGSPIDGPLAR